ncbi:hypothetical protein GCM10022198_10020 [Klugiella xanthotipulae]
MVPVYGDWPTLHRCIDSLLAHASPERCDVLFVNDCGPEADALEAGILEAIEGHPTLRYERNPHNLGFVGTCNRAVTELDQTDNNILLLNSDAELTAGALEEMVDVLHLSERHATVSPRSNNATIASLPFQRRAAENEPRETDRTARVFATLAERLPRYYVSPISHGFCLLVRRSLLHNHGLFDPVFGRGYNEENDLCLRLNALGYSSLIANHALVLHAGSASFGSEQRGELETRNSAILRERYPFYPDAVVRFIQNSYTAADRFADLIVPDGAPRRRVLVDLYEMPAVHNGTTRNILTFLETLRGERPEHLEVVLAAQPDAIVHFDLPSYGFRVVPYAEIDGIFDLGIAISPVASTDQLIALNRFCLRWVVSYLDIIALRTWDIRVQTPERASVMELALRYADRTIAISAATVADARLFFTGIEESAWERVQVIPMGAGSQVEAPRPATDTLPSAIRALIGAGDYALVMGNAFAHKQLRQALTALAASSVPVVVLGPATLAAEFPHATFLPSGALDEFWLNKLYRSCGCLVFPSAYEGFGLPLAEAARLGARTVAFDTVTTREVVATLRIGDYVTLFDHFDGLADAVATAITEPRLPAATGLRSLADYQREFWASASEVLASAPDLDRLAARDHTVGILAAQAEPVIAHERQLEQHLEQVTGSRSYALAQRLAAASSRLRRLRGGLRR